MKNVSLILVLILGCSLISYSQENNGIKLIKDFYKELYNKAISPNDIVHKHLQYSDTLQLKKNIEAISSLRGNPDGEDGFFATLRKDIIENNFSVSSYDTFSEVDKAKFKNLAKKKRKNVYKIDLKNTIPQYILLEKDKIVSFFGFQKAGSEDHIFIVF